MEQALDRPLLPEDERAQRRAAFAWARRCCASDGCPPPSDFALQVEGWVIDGRVTFDEAVTMLRRHYSGRVEA